MFQSFEMRTADGKSAERVALLRDRLKLAGLAGYVVPHADEHQSEYLPASAERLAWLTDFTGSAGAAIVLADKAAVFVDGRYTLQAADEVSPRVFEIVDLIGTPPAKWLGRNIAEGDRIGYDPMLFTVVEARRLERQCLIAGGELVAFEENLIDTLWTDRPQPPTAEISLHAVKYAGKSAADKIAKITAVLGEKKLDATVLTVADSVAWSFNIRGSDVPHNPAPLAFAIVRAKGKPKLYVDGRKLTNAIRNELVEIAEIAEPWALAADLQALGRANKKVSIDGSSAPARFGQLITEAGGKLVEARDPANLLKSRKNKAELAGAQRAHLRDGIAMVRFLAWLDREAPSGDIDEITAVEMLERIRTKTAADDGGELADISFDTIACAGPNGAIVHYRVTRQSNRKLEQDSLFLIDSGGQYRDGTTDITRTLAIGTPSAEMRTRFTLVLKGHIALARARFPAGTTGAQLDAVARAPLWNSGHDYDHGTGHGVGSFLSVHEGPARISKTGHVALETGMILSNEPGYYKPGAYGIRIENLVLVIEPKPIGGGDRQMHSFETLTLCPIDRRLIDESLLTEGERDWLDAYHASVREALSPRLAGEDLDWLEQAAQPA